MRVPNKSILRRAYDAQRDVDLEDVENQSWWETSEGGKLPSLPILVEAVRRGALCMVCFTPLHRCFDAQGFRFDPNRPELSRHRRTVRKPSTNRGAVRVDIRAVSNVTLTSGPSGNHSLDRSWSVSVLLEELEVLVDGGTRARNPWVRSV